MTALAWLNLPGSVRRSSSFWCSGVIIAASVVIQFGCGRARSQPVQCQCSPCQRIGLPQRGQLAESWCQPVPVATQTTLEAFQAALVTITSSQLATIVQFCSL